MELFDTHCHLDAESFDVDLADVVRRAAEAGVSRILAVGTTAASSARTLALAGRQAGVVAAVGIHPNESARAQPGDWERVVELSRTPGVAALGETGLDKHWGDAPFDVQLDYFDRHLRLSQASGLPVVIHTRECEAEMLAALREARARGPLRGIMHSFTLSESAADECLAMGLHLSFAGMLTYKKSDGLRRLAARVPADRLLVETDAPYLPPQPHRGQRNEPAFVVHTAQTLADARGQSLESIAELTTSNARRLFAV